METKSIYKERDEIDSGKNNAQFETENYQPKELRPEKKLRFAKILIFLLLGSILILVFAKANIDSEAMDDAFSMVIPTFLSILGLVTAYYFEKR